MALLDKTGTFFFKISTVCSNDSKSLQVGQSKAQNENNHGYVTAFLSLFYQVPSEAFE